MEVPADQDAPTGDQLEADQGIFVRDVLGYLRERDIDLLLCMELHADAALAKHLATRAGLADARFNGAWVSVSNTDGESDLIVIFQTPNAGDVVLLIENKIDANFQPDQAKRYRIRADQFVDEAEASRALTMLVAPAEYVEGAESEPFDVKVTYEEICASLAVSDDPRSKFFSGELAAAIEKRRQRSLKIASDVATDLWTRIWQLSQEIAPDLNMWRPNEKSRNEGFIYFRGCPALAHSKLIDIVYKFETGNADLQLRQTMESDLRARLGDVIDADMQIVQAGKSASVRIKIPIVNSSSTKLQEDKIRTGLSACARLLDFYRLNKAAIGR